MIKLFEGETDQEAFDFVVGKLREQGEPAVIGDGNSGSCLYQAPNGHRCAAGHLMGDKPYDSSSGMSPTIDRLVESRAVRLPRNIRLILAMQSAHDHPALRLQLRGKEWARKAAECFVWVAHEHNLYSAFADAWLESLT